MQTQTITDFLCLKLSRHSLNLSDEETLAGKRVREAYLDCAEKGVDPFSQAVIVDIGCSAKFASYKLEASPCLAATRCAQRNYFCSQTGEKLTMDQLQELQG